MPVHEDVLAAARRLGAERGDWTFTPDEIVRALPHLNPNTVRTHVTSRCCENAPKNHPHKWPYFRRVGRGVYKVLPAMRGETGSRVRSDRVAESRSAYGVTSATSARDTIHGVLSRSAGHFVAECLEIAVVTQGRTLDETIANLKEAIALHLDGEDSASLGLAPSPRLVVTYETALSGATT